MREAASLAGAYGVRLHTHLAESDDDVAYSHERFGCTPAQFAESTGWTGPHVWHAREVVIQSRAALALERFLCRRFAERVIAVSNVVADQLDPANVVVLDDPFDPDEFQNTIVSARKPADRSPEPDKLGHYLVAVAGTASQTTATTIAAVTNAFHPNRRNRLPLSRPVLTWPVLTWPVLSGPVLS